MMPVIQLSAELFSHFAFKIINHSSNGNSPKIGTHQVHSQRAFHPSIANESTKNGLNPYAENKS